MIPGEVDGVRFLRALGRLGWQVARVRGSHRVLKHPTRGTVVVAFHGKLSRNSVQRALRQCGISEQEYLDEL
jgi:predicted RNA binding protein YcfA (HicA-like mRNA interferase family)